MRKGLISRSLAANSLQERYAGERLAKFQEIVEQNDLYRWALEATECPLRPDTERETGLSISRFFHRLLP